MTTHMCLYCAVFLDCSVLVCVGCAHYFGWGEKAANPELARDVFWERRGLAQDAKTTSLALNNLRVVEHHHKLKAKANVRMPLRLHSEEIANTFTQVLAWHLFVFVASPPAVCSFSLAMCFLVFSILMQ